MIDLMYGYSMILFTIAIVFLVLLTASASKRIGGFAASQVIKLSTRMAKDVLKEEKQEKQLEKDIKREISLIKKEGSIFDRIVKEVKKAVGYYNKGKLREAIDCIDDVIYFVVNDAISDIEQLIKENEKEEGIVKEEERENLVEIIEAKAEERVRDKNIRKIAKQEEKIDKAELKEEEILDKIEKKEIKCLREMLVCLNKVKESLKSLRSCLSVGNVSEAQEKLNEFKKLMQELNKLHKEYIKLVNKEEKAVTELDKELKKEEKLISKLRLLSQRRKLKF